MAAMKYFSTHQTKQNKKHKNVTIFGGFIIFLIKFLLFIKEVYWFVYIFFLLTNVRVCTSMHEATFEYESRENRKKGIRGLKALTPIIKMLF